MIKNKVSLIVMWLMLHTLPATAACVLDITAVDFGNYNVFETGNLEGTGSVDISCNPRAAFMMTFSAGNSNNYATRQLSYFANQLNYNLYVNAGMTKVLGDGTANTAVFDGNNIRTRSFTIYGRIPARQNVRVGSYTDNIMVNLYF